MRRLRGRRLHPELWMLGDCDDGYRCSSSSPPSPHDYHPSPSPSPAPAPQSGWRWWPDPCPPMLAPAPSPVPVASWGRRDQGHAHGYGSPPVGTGTGRGGGGDDHNRRLITYAMIAAAAIAFASLILLGVSVAVRRRQLRRRRQALLAAPAPPAPPAPFTDADDGPEGGVVHHVWYIRTVGLDEAAISSIAATRYRAGAGLLGAADCTVCLGEFRDGELLRLLPRCGHAFHVPCIDTWLRAHVSCPLCRSDVIDTSGGGVESSSAPTPPPDPVVEDANAAAAQADFASEAMDDHEQEEEINQPQQDSPAEDQPTLPDPLPALPQNVRRAASMDAAIVSTAADVAAALERLPEAAPEEEQQSGTPKQDSGPPCAKASGSGHRSNLSIDRLATIGIPRSFFSRHGRARSSVLPL